MIARATVSESGQPSGFDAPTGGCGAFGSRLCVGQRVTGVWAGDGWTTGAITQIYSHIQTGHPGSGAPNYVAIEIEAD